RPVEAGALIESPIARRNCAADSSLTRLLASQSKMGGGGKIPYPKHVWSPAGGWYAQPANWRGNTLVAGAIMFGIVAVTWKFSAERETWARKPESWEWHPSRYWSKQLIQWDKEDRLKAEQSKSKEAQE
ncbi:Uncharacterized protein TCAP_06060, partial [Tolypocladium capitatum]